MLVSDAKCSSTKEAMDLTPIFKASVMAVRLRNKSLPVPNKNRILRKRKKDEFSTEAKDICRKITSLKNLLLENRAAYMRFATHLKNSAQMTDEQRDLIDKETEKFIDFYTQHIAKLRSERKHLKLKKQLDEHVEGVLELLANYLKSVQKIHLEQKRYRMQYELDTYRFLKLASEKEKIPIKPAPDIPKEELNESKREDVENHFKESQSEMRLSPQKVALDEDMQKSQIYEENALSAEDIQLFESENVQLYQELQGLSEEVEQIEKNVVDIAKLQEIFTEKVSLQKYDIEKIANVVVGATENIKDANEQIKQAIQRNAGLRIWVLFFLLVMSFSLLFLDWYND